MLVPILIPTDLWKCIELNQQGNSLLAAVLYHYCPASAFYYNSGVIPHSQPIDPFWKALEDYSSGKPLIDYVNEYGFSSIVNELSKYREDVVIYRRLNMTDSPEIYPLFRGGHLTHDKRFGINNALDKFGGESNLFQYVRTWIFLIPDWFTALNLNYENAKLSLVQVGIRFKVSSHTLKYPLWKIQEGDTQLLFALSPYDYEDWIKAGFLKIAGSALGISRVYLFDPVFGKVKIAKGLDPADFESLIENLIKTSKSGPYPPLHAIQRRCLCNGCVFKPMCFIENELSPYALNFYENTQKITAR